MTSELNSEAWNRLLVTSLISDWHEGVPNFIFVDRELLAAVGEFDNSIDAVESFAAAFTSAHDDRGRYHKDDPFGYYKRKLRDSIQEQDEIPNLMGIMMAVLAVTEPPLPGDRANNVYSVQRKLLGYEDLDGGIPPGYDTNVRDMFNMWNNYLLSPAGLKYGLPTANNSILEHQGWAWSQAVFDRRHRWFISEWVKDRADEFLQLGTVPSADPHLSARLLRKFIETLNWYPLVKRSLEVVLNSPEKQKILAEVLLKELLEPRDLYVKYRQSVSGSLLFFPNSERQIRPCIRVSSDLVGEKYLNYLDEIAELNLFDDPFQIDWDGDDESFLRGGGSDVKFGINRIKVQFGSFKAFLFEELQGFDCYISTRRPIPGRQYLALVHNAVMSEFARDLEEIGANEPIDSGVAIGSWRLFQGITATRFARPDYESVIPVPRSNIELGLAGGLRIGDGFRFITGGEPDIAYPEADSLRIWLDGSEIDSIHPEGGVLPLRGSLTPGSHEVKSEWKTIRFEVVDSVKGESALDEFRNDSAGGSNSASETDGIGMEHVPFYDDWQIYAATKGGKIYQLRIWMPPIAERLGIPTLGVYWYRLVNVLPKDSVGIICTPPRGDSSFHAVPKHFQNEFSGSGNIKQISGQKALRFANGRMSFSDDDSKDLWEKVRLQMVRNTVPHFIGEEQFISSTNVHPVDSIEHVSSGPFDLVLRWLSEQPERAMTLARFNAGWKWLCEAGVTKIQPNTARHYLCVLGHTVIDFEAEIIKTVSPTLVPIPGIPKYLQLVGYRPERLISSLRGELTRADNLDGVFEPLFYRAEVSGEDMSREPIKVLLQYSDDSTTELRKRLALGSWNFEFVEEAGTIDGFLNLADYEFLATEIEEFLFPQAEFRSLDRAWVEKLVRRFEEPGVYRFPRRNGTSHYLFLTEGGTLKEVDAEYGNALLYSRSAIAPAVRFVLFENSKLCMSVPRAEGQNGLEAQPIHFEVKKYLVSQSGLLPLRQLVRIRDNTVNCDRYENITRDIAEKVSKIYGMRLVER